MIPSELWWLFLGMAIAASIYETAIWRRKR